MVKYGNYNANSENYLSGFPFVNESFIKPLARNPLFAASKWDLKPFRYTEENIPIYLIYDRFNLVLGGKLFFRQYMNQFDSDDRHYSVANLPQLSSQRQYIVSRYPLSQPASFDPLLPLDFWSWLLSIAAFFAMAILIIFSHISLRTTQASILDSLYYCTDFWRDIAWFKTNSFLLSLWAISFLLINNMYQINFRSGLICQNMESAVNSWDDVDMFNIHIHTFSFSIEAPVNKIGFFLHKNLMEFDRYYYRFITKTIIMSS